MTSNVEVDGQNVQITNGKRENARAWFTYSGKDPADASLSLAEVSIEYHGLKESLEVVRDAMMGHSATKIKIGEHCEPLRQSGDDSGQDTLDDVGCTSTPRKKIYAILGFSQGAVLCHIIASIICRKGLYPSIEDMGIFENIQCAIMMSGFPSVHQQGQSGHKDDNDSALERCAEDDTDKIVQQNIKSLDMKSLHIIGEKDTSVPPKFGKKLVECFVDGTTYVHSKGHVVPQDVATCEQIIDFLDSCWIQT